MKLIRIQVRQHRVQQQHSILIIVLMQHLERSRTAARFNHIPARMPQLVMQALAELGVRADDKNIDCNLILLVPEWCDGRCHESIPAI